MRNAAAHASILQNHSDLLVLQQMQLGRLQQDVSDGNARICNQLENLNSRRNAIQCSQTFQGPQTLVTQTTSDKRYIYMKRKNRSSLRFRVPLLPWLTGRTWEIAMNQSQASRSLHIHPVYYRASDSPALQYVREGNITAVDKLLRAGELSIWDVETTTPWVQTTLLGVRMVWPWNLANLMRLACK